MWVKACEAVVKGILGIQPWLKEDRRGAGEAATQPTVNDLSLFPVCTAYRDGGTGAVASVIGLSF